MPPDYGTITSVDIATAYAYACDRINMEKCNDSEAQAKVCAHKGLNCLKWKQNDSMRIWNPPSLITQKECTEDTKVHDCKDQSGAPDCIKNILPSPAPQLVCGYKPALGFGKDAVEGGIQSGKCHIIDKQTCIKYSKLPYTCDATECKFIKDAKGAYTEWSPYAGMCNDNRSCIEDTDCPQGNYCMLNSAMQFTCQLQGGSTCQPGSVCDNGVCTCKNSEGKDDDDLCAGTSVCTEGLCSTSLGNVPVGQCILGNFINKQWCENPQSRCAPDDSGNFPSECQGSSTQKGVTDVPPFFYNNKIGQCFMTKDYCTFFDLDIYSGKSCTPQIGPDGEFTKSTCTNTPWDICYPRQDSGGKIGDCTGPGAKCSPSAGESFGEFLVGKTLFAAFSGKHCDLYKHPHELAKSKEQSKVQDTDWKNKLLNIFKQFANLPKTLETIADPSLVESKKLLQKDFTPGINLYLITWKPEADIKPANIRVGFDVNQVRNKYPQIIYKRNGLLYIKINKKDITNDKALKRLYLALGTLDWMTINISNMFLNSKIH